MTPVRHPPSRPATAARPNRAPAGTRRHSGRPPTLGALTVAGVGAAVRAAGLGVLAVLLVVLLGWATAARTGADATDAVATALLAWLAGQRAHLAVPGGELSLAPLGLSALSVALLHAAALRAGRAIGIRSWAAVLATVTASATAYGVLATVVAVLARTSQVQAEPLTAFLGAATVAVLGTGTGATRAAGRAPALWWRLPATVRVAVPAAAGAVAVLLAGGAVLAGAALAVDRSRTALLVDSLQGGLSGAVLLTVLCLLYLPTAVGWGAAYVVGPGFAVGAGTVVSPFGTSLGAVPALPLLAALPQEPGPGWAPVVLGVPLAAGVLAGLLVHRRVRGGEAGLGGPGWRPVAAVSAVAGGLVSAGVAGLAAVTAGSGGPGRLAVTGPDWWAVAPLAGLQVGLVAAATLAVLRRGS